MSDTVTLVLWSMLAGASYLAVTFALAVLIGRCIAFGAGEDRR